MRNKRMAKCLESYDKTASYDVSTALENVLKTATAKFDESVELHVRLGVDGRNADQQVRGVVVLPNGTGKSVRVLVIARGDKADEATKAGADFVGGEEIVAKINGGWLDFIKDVKAGKVEYRLDKTNNVHVIIGKKSFGKEKLLENFNTIMEALVKAKPAAAKGQYIKSVTLASSMGPGVKVTYNI